MPVPIDTRMIRDLGNETVDAMVNASPLRRLGDPQEVAGLVLWLCSEAAVFNAGAVFDMSGGARYYFTSGAFHLPIFNQEFGLCRL